MAEFKIVRKTEREFAQGYTLVEGELGQEIDTERVKAGPGVWANLPYIVDGPVDINTLRALLTLHLNQVDPHLDRAYTDVRTGGGGGAAITTLADTDTVSTSAGVITVANLRSQIVTDLFLQGLPAFDAVSDQSAANAAALAGLANDSTVLNTHNRGALGAGTMGENAGAGAAIVDTFGAVVGRLFETEDRLIYASDWLFTNISGAAANVTLLMKMNGVNGHTKIVSIPSTAAGQSYLSTVTVEATKVSVADGLGHWHRTRWAIRAASAHGSNSAPTEGYLYDGEWLNTAEGTDWGPDVIPCEARVTPATGVGYRFMGSSYVHVKGVA